MTRFTRSVLEERRLESIAGQAAAGLAAIRADPGYGEENKDEVFVQAISQSKSAWKHY